jgi:maleate isomerase
MRYSQKIVINIYGFKENSEILANSHNRSMKRLGVIVPSSNTLVEQEFSNALQNTKVSLHFTRIPLNNVTVEGLSAMEKHIETASMLLNDAGVDAVVFACTSGSLIKGKDHDAAIAKKIIKVCNCPAVVTSGAVVDSLRKVGAKKVALVTPYIDEINKKEIDFLAQNGFEITKAETLNLIDNLEIGTLSATKAATLARKANSIIADAIFVSCTNFATFTIINTLETQLKKPVISSNSATLWAALNALQLKVSVSLGKLFGV